MGLRWSNATDATGLARKEQLITVGLRMRLSPDSSIDSGLTQLNSETNASLTSPGESTRIRSIYARLEHRF